MTIFEVTMLIHMVHFFSHSKHHRRVWYVFYPQISSPSSSEYSEQWCTWTKHIVRVFYLEIKIMELILIFHFFIAIVILNADFGADHLLTVCILFSMCVTFTQNQILNFSCGHTRTYWLKFNVVNNSMECLWNTVNAMEKFPYFKKKKLDKWLFQ